MVALGSNLGSSVQIIQQALERLQSFSAEPLLKSSLRETAPLDCPPGSSHFINAVAILVPRPDETPETLLAELQQIEKQFGRQPTAVRNAPRPLDLDLIAFGNERRSTGQLTLPHPRAHLRRFVLEPLSEIAPELILPGQTKTAAELLRELPSSGGASSASL